MSQISLCWSHCHFECPHDHITKISSIEKCASKFLPYMPYIHTTNIIMMIKLNLLLSAILQIFHFESVAKFRLATRRHVTKMSPLAHFFPNEPGLHRTAYIRILQECIFANCASTYKIIYSLQSEKFPIKHFINTLKHFKKLNIFMNK